MDLVDEFSGIIYSKSNIVPTSNGFSTIAGAFSLSGCLTAVEMIPPVGDTGGFVDIINGSTGLIYSKSPLVPTTDGFSSIAVAFDSSGCLASVDMIPAIGHSGGFVDIVNGSNGLIYSKAPIVPTQNGFSAIAVGFSPSGCLASVEMIPAIGDTGGFVDIVNGSSGLIYSRHPIIPTSSGVSTIGVGFSPSSPLAGIFMTPATGATGGFADIVNGSTGLVYSKANIVPSSGGFSSVGIFFSPYCNLASVDMIPAVTESGGFLDIVNGSTGLVYSKSPLLPSGQEDYESITMFFGPYCCLAFLELIPRIGNAGGFVDMVNGSIGLVYSKSPLLSVGGEDWEAISIDFSPYCCVGAVVVTPQFLDIADGSTGQLLYSESPIASGTYVTFGPGCTWEVHEPSVLLELERDSWSQLDLPGRRKK